MRLPVSGKIGKGKFFLIDDEDYEKIKNRSCYCNDKGYVKFKMNGKQIILSRFLMSAGENVWVDHINGDKLDNRKSNLRFCNALENNQNKKVYKNNTSGYKGVTWKKANSNYVAQITIQGKKTHIGSFDDVIDAARAYNRVAQEHFKEFAKLNVIGEYNES